MSETLDTPIANAPMPTHETSWEREIGGIHVVFGAGRLSELGALCSALGGREILLVTDPGLVASGHVSAALAALDKVEIGAEVFDGVSANPTTDEVEAGTETVRGKSIQLIVALGGGSAMDCAKGINFLLTNGGRMEDYWGFGKASQPMLPAIGIPTTAGTGSDAQSYALISQATSHRKMACGDPKARFHTVLLDPALLATVPRRVAAAAGMDALSHALETQVSSARTQASSPKSRRAFELLEPSIEAVARPGSSAPEDRSRALLGAHLAGAGIEASMLGAAHAAANPLTARFGVPHGEAIGLMLPAVIRFNAPSVETLYSELWPAGSESLAARVEAIRDAMDLPSSLRAFGVKAEDLPALAASAGEERTGRFNPRSVDPPAFEELYESAL